MTRSDSDDDLLRVIAEDHSAIDGVLTELEEQRENLSADYQRELVEHVIASLVRHIVAKEQYLYPEIRQLLPDGDSVAEQGLSRLQELEELLKQLEGSSPGHAEFGQLLESLTATARAHFEQEERELLPRLAEACGKEHRQSLGAKMVIAKDSAPTRPHPSAPDTPPANLITDPGIGLIDKIRDAFR